MGKLASHHSHHWWCPLQSTGTEHCTLGTPQLPKGTGTCIAHSVLPPYLPEGLTQLSQDALLIKHLPLVAVLIVVMDALPHVCRELVEGHVLLHLFVLYKEEGKRRSYQHMQQRCPLMDKHKLEHTHTCSLHVKPDLGRQSGAGESNCVGRVQASLLYPCYFPQMAVPYFNL